MAGRLNEDWYVTRSDCDLCVQAKCQAERKSAGTGHVLSFAELISSLDEGDDISVTEVCEENYEMHELDRGIDESELMMRMTSLRMISKLGRISIGSRRSQRHNSEVAFRS